jgi:uncharacterized delta-60 repeat protein
MMLATFQYLIKVNLLSIVSVVFLIGCSSGGINNPPVVPHEQDFQTEISGNGVSPGDNTHQVLSYSVINLDATDPDDIKAEIIPARLSSMHLNILTLLETGICTDCFKIVGFNMPQPGTLDVDIQITHPFDSSQLNFTVFDVRGIIMFDGSHYFPVSGLTMSDSSMGNGELLNAEGFSQLYNYETLSAPVGDFFRYYQGKLATPTVPNANLNGFIRHISSNPANTRNALYPGDSVTRTYTLKMPSSMFVLGYAVDASWDLPTADPVTDPMTQFPTTANCIEPWKMLVTEQKIGDGLTTEGGQTKLLIDVYDWQGKGSHHDPIVECPNLFTGQIPATFVQPGDGYARYEATISNALLAPVGSYKILVIVEDNANASAPPWFDLTAYSIFNVNVGLGEGTGNLIWAKRAGGISFNDYGYGITTLSDNSMVVTGMFEDLATFGSGEPNQTVLTCAGYTDIFIARYNSDGTLVWAKRAGGTSYDNGYGITTLSDDSTVVTGVIYGTATFGPGEPNETVLTSAGNHDIFIARYNPDGSLAWAKRAGGAYWEDYGYGITRLSDNSTVVTGMFADSATFGSGEPNEIILTCAGYTDIFIARYNSDGNLAWAKRAGGPTDNNLTFDCGNGITTLSDNSTVVTGVFDGSATFGPGELNQTVLTSAGAEDIFIARYNPDGTLAWAKRAGGNSSDNDMGLAVKTLSDNSTVVTGYFVESATFGPGELNQTFLTGGGTFIARYSPNGMLSWAKDSGGSNGRGITALSDNSTVVTGVFTGTDTFGEGEPNETILTAPNAGIFVARYNPDSTLAWAKRAGGESVDSYDEGYGITALSDYSVVVTGCFADSAPFGPGEPNETVLTADGLADIFVARYEP